VFGNGDQIGIQQFGCPGIGLSTAQHPQQIFSVGEAWFWGGQLPASLLTDPTGRGHGCHTEHVTHRRSRSEQRQRAAERLHRVGRHDRLPRAREPRLRADSPRAQPRLPARHAVGIGQLAFDEQSDHGFERHD
jgi:hypothetical protein